MKRWIRAALPILALSLALNMAPMSWAASGFTDVPDDHWASDYIRQARQKGWINGVDGSRYAPYGTLTHAEFLKMVTAAFYPAEYRTGDAREVWYAPAWRVASQHDLMDGSSVSALSGLTAPINRYDMAQIIANVAEAKEVSANPGAVDRQAIGDWNSIPATYRGAVAAAYSLGILNGKGDRFAGGDTMTRAEAAAVLCRMDTAIPDTSGSDTQTPGTQKPDTQTPSASEQELTAEIVRLVNIERAKEGLAPLGTYDSLTRAAQIRAPEIITLFSHDRPDGRKCYTALDETGANRYAYASGENIAAGNATAAATVEQWMNSPGHRANILSKNYTHIGVGYAKGGTYRHYWVQMFVGTKTVPDDSSDRKPTVQQPNDQKPSVQQPDNQQAGTQKPDTQKPDTQKPAATQQELTAEIVRLVNIERAKEGLAPLGTYDSLTRAAQTRAPEIITLFSHDRPDGRSCFTALDETGAKKNAYTWGENIAAGNATAAATVEQWMNSPGHRANILNKNYTHIGVGYAAGGSYRHYWVQMFVGTKTVPDSGNAQDPADQTDTNRTPDTPQSGSQPPDASKQTAGIRFSSPIVTLSPNHSRILTVLDSDFRAADNVTYTSESPDLLRVSNGVVYSSNKTGTGYITAHRNGESARLTVRVIPLADQINLSVGMHNIRPNGYGTTELYIFKTSKYYGQDVRVSWSVDQPALITLEELTSDKGNPAVRYRSTGEKGDAVITCRVTGTDGSAAEEYCNIHIA